MTPATTAKRRDQLMRDGAASAMAALEPIVSYKHAPISRIIYDDKKFMKTVNHNQLLGAASLYADSVEASGGRLYLNELVVGLVYGILELARCGALEFLKDKKRKAKHQLIAGSLGVAAVAIGMAWASSNHIDILFYVLAVMLACDSLITVVNLWRYIRFEARAAKVANPILGPLSYLIAEVAAMRFDPDNAKQKLLVIEQKGGQIPSIVHRLLSLQSRFRFSNIAPPDRNLPRQSKEEIAEAAVYNEYLRLLEAGQPVLYRYGRIVPESAARDED
jgi:hypothetical protein